MDLFDIIGPVMIGPSSSHTAGAARIGRIARLLLGEQPVEARIGLWGSFQKTYQGHGTDRALIGGLLGMAVDDTRLRDSLRYAREAGLTSTFTNARLRNAHPNTVVLDLTGAQGRTLRMQAASVGGGEIIIEAVDGLETAITTYWRIPMRHLFTKQQTPSALATRMLPTLWAGWRSPMLVTCILVGR